MKDKNIKELVNEHDICNPQYAATINEILQQDTDTLAGNELESIDRIIAPRSKLRRRIEIVKLWLYYKIYPSRQYGIDRDIQPHDGKFYVFCERCNDIFKVKYLLPCMKLVIGCEKYKVCPNCKKHLHDPPYTAKTQAKLRKILQDQVNHKKKKKKAPRRKTKSLPRHRGL